MFRGLALQSLDFSLGGRLPFGVHEVHLLYSFGQYLAEDSIQAYALVHLWLFQNIPVSRHIIFSQEGHNFQQEMTF